MEIFKSVFNQESTRRRNKLLQELQELENSDSITKEFKEVADKISKIIIGSGYKDKDLPPEAESSIERMISRSMKLEADYANSKKNQYGLRDAKNIRSGNNSFKERAIVLIDKLLYLQRKYGRLEVLPSEIPVIEEEIKEAFMLSGIIKESNAPESATEILKDIRGRLYPQVTAPKAEKSGPNGLINSTTNQLDSMVFLNDLTSYKKIVELAEKDPEYIIDLTQTKSNDEIEKALDQAVLRVMRNVILAKGENKKIYGPLLKDLNGYFGYVRRDDIGVFRIFEKNYSMYGELQINRAFKAINFGDKDLFTSLNIAITENKDFVVNILDGAHFIAVEKKGDQYIVSDSIPGSEASKNAIKILRDNGIPKKNIQENKDIARQVDGVSCGPYSLYNSHQNFFHRCGVNHNKMKPKDFRDALQTSVLGLSIADKVLEMLLENELQPGYEYLKSDTAFITQIKLETRDDLARAQSKLVKNSIQYQEKDPVKFFEEYLAYVGEIKYAYINKIYEKDRHAVNPSQQMIDYHSSVELRIKNQKEVQKEV